MFLKRCSICRRWKRKSKLVRCSDNKNGIRPYCKECHKKRSHSPEPIKITMYTKEWDPHILVDDMQFGMNLLMIGGYNSGRIVPGRQEHGV